MRNFLTAVIMAGMLTGCGGCQDWGWPESLPDHTVSNEIPETSCKEALESWDKYNRMKKACLNDPYPASSTTYTVYSVAANMYLLTRDLGDLTRLSGSLVNFAPQGELDVGTIISSALRKVGKRTRAITAAVEAIRDRPYDQLLVEVPQLRVDQPVFPKDMNLGGRWNRVSLLLAGLLGQSMLNLERLVSSQTLKLDLDILSSPDRSPLDALAGASFLLTRDSDAWQDFHSGLQALFTDLAGDGSDVAGRQGLLAALDEEIARLPDGKSSVVAVQDKDRDGKFGRGDAIYFAGLPFKLQADAVPGLWINRELRRSSLESAVRLLAALRDNLTTGQPDRIDVAAYVNPLWVDLGLWIDDAIWPQFDSSVAFDLHSFFANLVALHNILPTVYASNVSMASDFYYFLDGTPVTDATGIWVDNPGNGVGVEYSFLIECEYANTISEVADILADPGSAPGWNDWLCPAHTYYRAVSQPSQYGFGYGIRVGAQDRAHFFAPFAGVNSAYPASFFLYGYKPVPVIAADEVYPDLAADSGLAYIGWQDPTFAGALWVDPAGTGSWQTPTLQSLNRITVESWRTYGPALRSLWQEVGALGHRYRASLPLQ